MREMRFWLDRRRKRDEVVEPALEGARERLGETKGEIGRLWTGDWEGSKAVIVVMLVIRGTNGDICKFWVTV